jgi:hypothetical protein
LTYIHRDVYVCSMKQTKKQNPSQPDTLQEAIAPYVVEPAMVRTQIYLTRAEHNFLQNEAARRNEPMSAVIRSIIDERMTIPEDAWENNPLLDPTPPARSLRGREDGVLNHDYYIYGGAKKYHKVRGEWVPINPSEI